MTYGRKLLLLRAPTVLCLLLSFTGEVFAAPSIGSVSGTVSNNAQLNIAGTEFGTRGDYHTHNNSGLAWAWKDFEDSSTTSYGFDPGGGGGLVLRSSGGRSNSQYHGARVADSNIKAGDMGSAPVIFSSVWINHTSSSTSGKFLRWRTHEVSGNYEDLWLATGSYNFYIRGNSDTSPEGTKWDSVNQFTVGTWQRLDMLMQLNSQIPYLIGMNNNSPQWVPDPHYSVADPGGRMSFNLGGGGGAYSGEVAVDDVYVDFTQARVELCDTSTWSNRSRCEIQIPLSWSPTSITINVNRGSFANGNTAYLYVVDANGHVNSQGFQVTVGADAPSPITTLRITP